ncbi:hypothetical protein STEG23_019480, partial [Scotinomys teguina]
MCTAAEICHAATLKLRDSFAPPSVVLFYCPGFLITSSYRIKSEDLRTSDCRTSEWERFVQDTEKPSVILPSRAADCLAIASIRHGKLPFELL